MTLKDYVDRLMLPTGPDTTENIKEVVIDDTPLYTPEEVNRKLNEDIPIPKGNPGTEPKDYTYDGILKTMADLHKRKNADYGDAHYLGYKKYGIVYYLVQIHNKLTRLENLTLKNHEKNVDESIEDTLLDLANYSVFALESLHRNE